MANSTATPDQSQVHLSGSAKLLGASCIAWVLVQFVLAHFGLPGLGWLFPLALIAATLFLGRPRRSTLRAILMVAVLSLLACLVGCVVTFTARHYLASVTFLVQSAVSVVVVYWNVVLLTRLKEKDGQSTDSFDSAKLGNALGRAVRRWRDN